MPKYTFVGPTPIILIGLSQGVDADHVPAEGNPEVPEGATVIVYPGDSVDTHDEPYICAFLEEDAPKPAAKSTPKPDSTPDKTSKEK